jgi:hypothetical protein
MAISYVFEIATLNLFSQVYSCRRGGVVSPKGASCEPSKRLEMLMYLDCSKNGINLDFGTVPVHLFCGHARLAANAGNGMNVGRGSDER